MASNIVISPRASDASCVRFTSTEFSIELVVVKTEPVPQQIARREQERSAAEAAPQQVALQEQEQSEPEIGAAIDGATGVVLIRACSVAAPDTVFRDCPTDFD